MDNVMVTILETPLIVRAAVIMFIIWLLYLILSRVVLKIIALFPMLFNWVWVLIYKFFSGLSHILHSNFGKPFVGIDQAVSDFFGALYGFVDKIKTAILTTGKSKRPFGGTAFVIAFVITCLIALPTWLDGQMDENLLTLPYRTYATFENWLLGAIFGD